MILHVMNRRASRIHFTPRFVKITLSRRHNFRQGHNVRACLDQSLWKLMQLIDHVIAASTLAATFIV